MKLMMEAADDLRGASCGAGERVTVETVGELRPMRRLIVSTSRPAAVKCNGCAGLSDCSVTSGAPMSAIEDDCDSNERSLRRTAVRCGASGHN